MQRRSKNIGTPDGVLIVAFVLLVLIGMIMVYSASIFYAEQYFNDQFYYFKRQFVAFVIGLVMVMVLGSFRLSWLQKLAPIAIIFALTLAAYQGGVKQARWFSAGFIHFQTVDVVRFALTLYLPYYLVRSHDELKNFTEGLLPALIIIFLLTVFTVLQRDFSSSMTLFLLSITILAAGPTQLTHILYVTGGILLAGFGYIKITGHNYERISAFLHPESDPFGNGYQILNALFGFQRGGIAGSGFAQSRAKMFFLPEAHNDYIFAIIGEEWGLIGTLFIVFLFGVVLLRGIRIAQRQHNLYVYYLTIGILANFMWYSVINIMVSLNMLPSTGIPLPFISYGGTALVINMALAGLLINLSRTVGKPSEPVTHFSSQEHRVFYYTRKRR